MSSVSTLRDSNQGPTPYHMGLHVCLILTAWGGSRDLTCRALTLYVRSMLKGGTRAPDHTHHGERVTGTGEKKGATDHTHYGERVTGTKDRSPEGAGTWDLENKVSDSRVNKRQKSTDS